MSHSQDILDNTPIAQLKNLAEKSAKCLTDIDVYCFSDLKRMGSVQAFLRMETQGSFKPSLNFLYAMEGALQNVHWNHIDHQQKSRLLNSLEDARTHQALFLPLSENVIIQQTECWINNFIIKYNICPFAEHVVVANLIAYHVIYEEDIEDCLMLLIQHLSDLRKNDKIETALLIFPASVEDFDHYLEFLAIANQLIEDQDYSDDFQLASFHPDYCFEGEDMEDPANFTNRAPWPMLHLIRQSSIEHGLKYYKNPEQIPINNIKLTRELGADFLTKLRNRCLSLNQPS